MQNDEPALAPSRLPSTIAPSSGPKCGSRLMAPVNADGGGCTGDINLLGNFGIIHGVTITNNKLGATPNLSYCTFGGSSGNGFGPQAHDIVYRGNVFERGTTGKCGQYGAVTDFNHTRPGNVWTGNKYDDGTPVPAS